MLLFICPLYALSCLSSFTSCSFLFLHLILFISTFYPSHLCFFSFFPPTRSPSSPPTPPPSSSSLPPPTSPLHPPAAGYTGTSGRRLSTDLRTESSRPVSSSVVTEGCPDTCQGGFRPVCGSNNLTYGSDCYLELAKCRNPSLTKKADGVCSE